LSQRPDPVDVASLVIVVPLAVTSTPPARRPPTATPPLQPGEFRPSSSPAPAAPALCTTAAPLSSAVELPLRGPLRVASVAPSRSHRAASRRPVAPLRSHRDAPPARRRRQRRTATSTTGYPLLQLAQLH
ncbi:hypothetical protein U1Q18_014034, partial [Sarracenia purpurea var. burkii]